MIQTKRTKDLKVKHSVNYLRCTKKKIFENKTDPI